MLSMNHFIPADTVHTVDSDQDLAADMEEATEVATEVAMAVVMVAAMAHISKLANKYVLRCRQK